MKDESSLLVKYSTRFRKQFKKMPLEIKAAFREARELFYDDTHHPSLRNHALREKYTGFRSIDITNDWRAVFKVRETEKQTTATFYFLGTHDELYGKI